MYDRKELCTVKIVMRFHSESSKNPNTFDSVLKMYHRMYQKREIKKFVLPVEEFNED